MISNNEEMDLRRVKSKSREFIVKSTYPSYQQRKDGSSRSHHQNLLNRTAAEIQVSDNRYAHSKAVSGNQKLRMTFESAYDKALNTSLGFNPSLNLSHSMRQHLKPGQGASRAQRATSSYRIKDGKLLLGAQQRHLETLRKSTKTRRP